MFIILAAVATFAIAAALIYVGVYLVIGLGYLLYGAVVASGWVLFIAGWTVWKLGVVGYRVMDWSVDKCAPPIAARWHQWRDNRTVTAAPVTAERRPPVKEVGVVHWGYGHLDKARREVRELPSKPRNSCVATRRSHPGRAPRRRSLRG